MSKIINIISYFLLFSQLVFSDTDISEVKEFDKLIGNRYYFKDNGYVQFFNDYIDIGEYNPNKESRFDITSYDVKYVINSKITYVILENHQDGKWLILFSEDMILAYNSDLNDPIFIGLSAGPRAFETFWPINKKNVEVSSFLTEKNFHYSGENITSLKSWQPWVEGKEGYGIGEYLTIDSLKHPSLMISIGFISYDKPYLYEYNSRPKKIKIIDLETNDSHVFELEDTPGLQQIKFNDFYSHKVKIIVEEVFPGTKWDDTCINFMINY
ncbi:MAG: hypothetical protein PF518_18150 [Spirochaetaceae bacterium]|jgi:hypothetical protein|nr:hypothetical protein [Spirochaetaceae bacterium]